MTTPTTKNLSVHSGADAPNKRQPKAEQEKRTQKNRYMNLLNFLCGIGQDDKNKCLSVLGKVNQIKKLETELKTAKEIEHDQEFTAILNGLKDLVQDENKIRAIYKAREDYLQKFKKIEVDISVLREFKSLSAIYESIIVERKTSLILATRVLIKLGIKVLPLMDTAFLFHEFKEGHSVYLIWPAKSRMSTINTATIFTKNERKLYFQELEKYDSLLQQYCQEHKKKIDVQIWEALQVGLRKFEEFEDIEKSPETKMVNYSPETENQSTTLVQSGLDFSSQIDQSPDPFHRLENEGVSKTAKFLNLEHSLNPQIYQQENSESLSLEPFDFSFLNEKQIQEGNVTNSQRRLHETNADLERFTLYTDIQECPFTVSSFNRKRFHEEILESLAKRDETEEIIMNQKIFHQRFSD